MHGSSSTAGPSREQTYLEFDLDAETLALVEQLAAEGQLWFRVLRQEFPQTAGLAHAFHLTLP